MTLEKTQYIITNPDIAAQRALGRRKCLREDITTSLGLIPCGSSIVANSLPDDVKALSMERKLHVESVTNGGRTPVQVGLSEAYADLDFRAFRTTDIDGATLIEPIAPVPAPRDPLTTPGDIIAALSRLSPEEKARVLSDLRLQDAQKPKPAPEPTAEISAHGELPAFLRPAASRPSTIAADITIEDVVAEPAAKKRGRPRKNP